MLESKKKLLGIEYNYVIRGDKVYFPSMITKSFSNITLSQFNDIDKSNGVHYEGDLNITYICKYNEVIAIFGGIFYNCEFDNQFVYLSSYTLGRDGERKNKSIIVRDLKDKYGENLREFVVGLDESIRCKYGKLGEIIICKRVSEKE